VLRKIDVGFCVNYSTPRYALLAGSNAAINKTNGPRVRLQLITREHGKLENPQGCYYVLFPLFHALRRTESARRILSRIALTRLWSRVARFNARLRDTCGSSSITSDEPRACGRGGTGVAAVKPEIP